MATKIYYQKLLVFSLLVLNFSILTVARAQTLINTGLNLNSGGIIYAAEYFSFGNKYIVAGNFNSIGTQSRNSIALLNDDASLSLAADQLITSINGDILAVATYQNTIYIGGNFSSVNGFTRKGMAKFIFSSGAWFLDPWSPGLPLSGDGTTQTIHDINISGDTMFIAGDFMDLNNGNDTRYDQAAYKLSTMSLLTYGSNFYFTPGNSVIYNIRFYKGKIYTTGANWSYNLSLRRFSPNGIIDNTFNPSWSGSTDQTYDIEFYGDTVFLVSRYSVAGSNVVHAVNRINGSGISLNLASGGGGNIHSLSIYKKYLYYISSQTTPAPNNYLGGWNLTNGNFDWHAYPNSAFNNYIRKNIFRVKNKLFVSNSTLTTVNGISKTGLAIFCLEPDDPKMFTVFDTSVCVGENGIVYRIPQVLYASGYYWIYNGNDVSVNGMGGSVTLNGVSNNSVTLAFGMNATSGELMVIPFSECGETSDTTKIFIHVNSLPLADAGNDTSLTCTRTTLQLNGTSNILNAVYDWSGFPSSQSINISQPGNFIFNVTDPVTGCKNSDTVTVFDDTTIPDVILPPPSYELTCADSSILLEGSSNTSPVILNWRNVSSGMMFSNPFTTFLPGQYTLIVENTRNNCVDSASLIVTINQNIPHVGITGYTSINPFIPVDTLTCSRDSIVLNGYSNTTGAGLHWTDSSGMMNYGNPLVVDSVGFYYLLVTDNSNGCKNLSGYFITEFKNNPDVLITGSDALTCSLDSVQINASSSINNCSFQWTGSSGFVSANPASINKPGIYYVNVTRSDNGCFTSDSIEINYDPRYEISIGTDTVVCEGTVLIFHPIISGDHSGSSYLWSSGGTDSTELVEFTSSGWIVLNISNPNGCIGSDSIYVGIPYEPSDSIVTYVNCSSDTSGQINVYLSGGLAPYQFSLDGSSFQNSSLFTGLTFGEYLIWVKDSAGCNYSFRATISEESTTAFPFFLVSTNNEINDTVFLVDLSFPPPDSIEWIFPPEAIIYESGSVASLSFNDTGAYVVTLRGYYGDCIVDSSKTIFIHEQDLSRADFYNQNQLKEIKIFPNPNDGNFSIEVEFYLRQNFVVTITDISGNEHFRYVAIDQDYFFRNLSMPQLPDGNYILRVISEFSGSYEYFIIQK